MAKKTSGGNAMAPVLPLDHSAATQYGMIYDYQTLALQNLKMLVLTIPGERVGDCTFGVGLPKYLFENNTLSTRADISSKIREQVSKYLEYITIVDIVYHSSIEDPTISEAYLGIKIKFNINIIQSMATLSLEMNGSEVIASDYLVSYS